MKLKVLLSIFAFSGTVSASVVDLNVTNNGQVNYGGQTCSGACAIETNTSSILLTPLSNNDVSFQKWVGQTCDFGSKIIYPNEFELIGLVRGGAKTLQALDINNDGVDDLFGISLFDGTVKQFENTLSGFTSKIVAENLLYPSALDAFDFDGDGYQDLLVSDYRRGEIVILRNDGNGQLTRSDVIKIVGVKPYAFSVLDIEGDGSPELVISSFDSDTTGDLFQLVNSIAEPLTALYSNSGNGYKQDKIISTRAAVTLDTVVESETLHVIATEIVEKKVTIYSGKQTFAAVTVDTSSAPYGVAFADVDNDGRLDVVSAHYGPYSLRINYGLDNFSFEAAQELMTTGDGLTATAVTDINQDGIKDILTGEFNKGEFKAVLGTSYLGCGFNQNSSASVTAEFTQKAQTTPTTGSDPKSNDTSSGGSLSYLLMLAVFILTRKPQFKKNPAVNRSR